MELQKGFFIPLASNNSIFTQVTPIQSSADIIQHFLYIHTGNAVVNKLVCRNQQHMFSGSKFIGGTLAALKFKMTLNQCNHFLLIGAGVLISTLHISAFYYSYDAPKWAIYDIALSLSIFILAVKNRVSIVDISALGCINIAIIVVMLSSLYWAANPYAGIEWTLRYALAFLFITALLNSFSSRQLSTLCINIVVWSATAYCVVLIYERYVISLPRKGVGSFSPLGFQNIVGQVFNIWIPVLTYVVLQNIKKPIVVFYFAVLLILIFVLIEAATRGSLLGLFLGEILVVITLLRRQPKLALKFVSISSMLLVSLFLTQQIDFLKSQRLAAKLSSMKSGLNGTYGQRIPMFKNTWQMTLDNPIGVGANNFEYIHPRYARVGQSPNQSPFVNEKQILRTPHNFPLKIFSELGLFGGFLTCLVYLLVFIQGLKNAISGQLLDKWLLVSLVAVCLHSLVSGVFLNPASLFFSSLLIALILKRKHHTPRRLFRINLKRLFVFQLAIVPMLSSIWLSSHAYAFQGRKYGDIDKLKQAVELNPGNERAWYDLSRLQHHKFRDTAGSLASISRFIQLYPYHIRGLQIKAQREIKLGRWHQANYTLERLLNIYPSYKPALAMRVQVNKRLK